MARKKNTGYVVKTKSGKTGKIFHNEKFINDKIIVHVDNYEKPVLCDPNTIEIVGYFD